MRSYVLNLFLAIVAMGSLGCHRPIAHPELVDPVYLDIKKDAENTYNKITETQKELAKDKEDYEKAPIRTGMREDAHDKYFETDHQLEILTEKFRYFVLKARLRLKYDQKAYEIAYKNKKPWPDTDSFFEYETEKRLTNAPREWSPEARIKARTPAAATPKETSPEE